VGKPGETERATLEKTDEQEVLIPPILDAEVGKSVDTARATKERTDEYEVPEVKSEHSFEDYKEALQSPEPEKAAFVGTKVKESSESLVNVSYRELNEMRSSAKNSEDFAVTRQAKPS